MRAGSLLALVLLLAGCGPSDYAPATGSNAGRKFPPKGEPQITGINRIGLWSLYIKELRRFLKVQTQTVWAPAITTLLFLVIFTVALGRGGIAVGDPVEVLETSAA